MDKLKTSISGNTTIYEIELVMINKSIIFKSENIQLERIDITIGNCHTVKFREIIKNGIGDVIDVNEHKSFPEWYNREIKLNILLNE